MTEIVQSMFGLSPMQLQQQRQQETNAAAAKFATMDAAERGVMGLYQGGAGIGGMLGLRDPQMEQAQANQQLMGQLDPNDPDSYLKLAQQTQDPRLKIGLVQKANEIKAAQSKAAFENARTERETAMAEHALAQARALEKEKGFTNLPPVLQAILQKERIKALNPNDPSIPEMQRFIDANIEGKPKDQWTEPYQLGGATVQKNQSTGEIRTAVSCPPVTNVNAGPAAGPIDQETVDFYAAQSLAGDNAWQVGLARGKVGQQLIAAVKDRIPQMAKEQGITPVQAVANKQELVTKGSALKDFTSGQSSKAIRSFGVAIDHLDTLGKLGKALETGDLRALNSVGQAVSAWTGNPAPTNFDTAKQTVAAEVEKAIIGGATALGDRETAAANISRISSPAQLAGYIETVKKLMAGQLQGYEHQYSTATGRTDFRTRLHPKAAIALGELSVAAPPAPAKGGWGKAQAVTP